MSNFDIIVLGIEIPIPLVWLLFTALPTLTTFFFTGLSSLLNFYLEQIPEAVFSGMVLYMGVVALFGVQMIERFFLMFMAPGQHPDIPYLKNVSNSL